MTSFSPVVFRLTPGAFFADGRRASAELEAAGHARLRAGIV